MSCQEVCEFLDAYVDNELDVLTSSQFDRHLAECTDCRARLEQYRMMHTAVRSQMEYFEVPDYLRQQLRSHLASAVPRHDQSTPQQQHARRFPWVAVAAGIIGIFVVSAALLSVFGRSSANQAIAEQVVSNHIRSLQANHLSDVVSSDQHTVKPWFSGKLDFAPVIQDLSSRGFPLVGGRLDYLDNRAVAALVYKRRQHTINLFLWPSPNSDSSPRAQTIKGFNLIHWTHAHMDYWAVSDLNTVDLGEFVRDLAH